MPEFEHHKWALDLEFRLQQAESRLVLERPVLERVESGRALMGLRLLGDDTRSARQKIFAFTGPLGRFRVGDYGLLTPQSPECRGLDVLELGIPVSIVRIQGDELVLRLRRNEDAVLLHRGQAYVLDDEPSGWYPNYQRLSLALALAEYSKVPGQRLRTFLQGDWMPPDGAETAAVEIPPDLEGERVGDAYRMALTHAVSAVQGPPGTGKTYLLARVARALVEQGKSVILCCFTHRAINSALHAMVDAGIPPEQLGKVTGSDESDLPTGVQKLDRRRFWESPPRGMVAAMTVHAAFDPFWKELNRSAARRWEARPVREDLGEEAFWGALDLYNRRLIGKSSFPPPGRLADVVLFDEAGQLTIPMALCALPAASRAVFFGDHAQLPPISPVAADSDSHASIFHLVVDRYPDSFVRLNETHRMNAGLCHFPGEAFYEGDLFPTEAARERGLMMPPGDRYADILAPDPASLFLSVDHERCTQESPLEATLIADIVLALLAEGTLDTRRGLAVLAAHRRQTNVIREAIARMARDRGFTGERLALVDSLHVDTVDRMQGQERDLILYSLTASEPDTLDQEFDFLFLPNRFNVAITRARRKLLVVGSRRFFHHVPETLLHAPWQGEEGREARVRLQNLNVLKRWYLAHRDRSIDMTARALSLQVPTHPAG